MEQILMLIYKKRNYLTSFLENNKNHIKFWTVKKTKKIKMKNTKEC